MTDKQIIKALIIHDKGITTCVGCPYTGYADCSDKMLTDSLDLIKRQQAEIEKARAEAIKEFADSFDDELVKLRDTYFERGMKDYSLVCEVIHDYLYRTLREMVGGKE